jgi:hypothetical protein
LAHALNITAAAHRPRVHLIRFVANKIVSRVFITAGRTQKADLISPYESIAGVRDPYRFFEDVWSVVPFIVEKAANAEK